MSTRPPIEIPTTVPLQGAFLVTITPEGAAPILSLASFTVDGSMVEAPPGTALKTGVGSWKPNPSAPGYLIRFMRFIANPVTGFRGRADIRGTMILGRGGNSFTGDFVDTTFDANGNAIAKGRGTVRGERFFPPDVLE